jgi:hypothetical protein
MNKYSHTNKRFSPRGSSIEPPCKTAKSKSVPLPIPTSHKDPAGRIVEVWTPGCSLLSSHVWTSECSLLSSHVWTSGCSLLSSHVCCTRRACVELGAVVVPAAFVGDITKRFRFCGKLKLNQKKSRMPPSGPRQMCLMTVAYRTNTRGSHLP